ncbi:hypothetical protein PIB30_103501, partial [Stylosanthes scabra]|nr:hypothetical protein [Stylosanthes scabra]
NETEQILGIFVSWKTRAMNMDMLVTIVRVPLTVRLPQWYQSLNYTEQREALFRKTTPVVSEPWICFSPVKEIVQSSSLQQCGLQATTSEQYVTIEIPQDLIREYLAQNYTHLHLGAVRLILTLHGRKGLPITAKIALLDTTFKDYQNALIGALVTTLTNGSVILTISPDFTMRLTDPTLSQRIKIQVQLIGATQDAAAEQATLHHQVLYRVQDHALDL